jgi:hypothetical protein
MRLLIRLNAMSALWKQCQQGSSNEGWVKYIQAAALALGFSSETASLLHSRTHRSMIMSRREEFGPGGKKRSKRAA